MRLHHSLRSYKQLVIAEEEEAFSSAPKAVGEASMFPRTTLLLTPIHWITKKQKTIKVEEGLVRKRKGMGGSYWRLNLAKTSYVPI